MLPSRPLEEFNDKSRDTEEEKSRVSNRLSMDFVARPMRSG